MHPDFLLNHLEIALCKRNAKKSHSHGAYQDFVRDVGAPNILLTDNSKTQSGVKWQRTSRDNVTKQIHSVPHNQNQNQAERKVRDVKKRTILTLRYAQAPIVFWCYCMVFIVDCLNYSAQKELGYRTAMEKMYGNTLDISVFRFGFWETVWYYEPTAKFPKPNFLPARFVGIAWDHGDAFSYKVWTTPNGKWEDGVELIRNVVRSRQSTEDGPWSDYAIEDVIFTAQKMTRNQLRKRKRNSNRKLTGADESLPGSEPNTKRKVSFQDSPNPRATEQEETGGNQPTILSQQPG